MRKLLILLALVAPAHGKAVSGPPPHDGPLIARFFFSGPAVDGVPIYGEQLRCWSGTMWLPLRGATCIHLIFHDHPPEAIPVKQWRME